MRILTTIRAVAPRFAPGAPAAPDRSSILVALRTAASDADVHDVVVRTRSWLAGHGEDVPVSAALAALLERVQPSRQL